MTSNLPRLTLGDRTRSIPRFVGASVCDLARAFGESVIFMELMMVVFTRGGKISRVVSHFDNFKAQKPRTPASGLHPESRVNGSGVGAVLKNLRNYFGRETIFACNPLRRPWRGHTAVWSGPYAAAMLCLLTRPSQTDPLWMHLASRGQWIPL